VIELPYCSECGNEVKEGVSYCENCGGRLNVDPQDPQDSFSSEEKRTSPHPPETPKKQHSESKTEEKKEVDPKDAAKGFLIIIVIIVLIVGSVYLFLGGNDDESDLPEFSETEMGEDGIAEIDGSHEVPDYVDLQKAEFQSDGETFEVSVEVAEDIPYSVTVDEDFFIGVHLDISGDEIKDYQIGFDVLDDGRSYFIYDGDEEYWYSGEELEQEFDLSANVVGETIDFSLPLSDIGSPEIFGANVVSEYNIFEYNNDIISTTGQDYIPARDEWIELG